MDLEKQGATFLRVLRYVDREQAKWDYSDQPRPWNSFAFILSGGGVFEEEGQCFKASAGECVFTPMKSRYRLQWTEEPCTEFLSCQFVFPEEAQWSSGRRFLVQKFDSVDGVENALRFILENQDNPDRILEVLGQFYAVCSRLLPQLQFEKVPPYSRRIRNAVEKIEKGYREKMYVNELAASVGMSTSHFYSCFHRETGMSPVEYRNRVAVTRAEQLLTDPEQFSIEEVSEWTGFESSAYFRRVFRAYTGCSPREYRKKQAGI